ncbi:MAG: hypothetical protein ACI389_02150 [Methanobrevibacter sp.]|uniref:hypothetical protein n=1 Tax=Methanobrevibacter sp. TaxID=66852 RepID=UPI003EFF75B0
MKQKLSNDIIFEVCSSSNLLHKAIISFLFTTGLEHNMIRNLKIKDLLSSCSEYVDDGESIDDLLNKNPLDIVSCWQISDKSNVCIAFNTPETTKYLFDYLKDRKKYVDLTEESYLFKNYDKNKTPIVDEKPLNKDFITKELSRKKRELNKFHNGDMVLFNASNIGHTFVKICEEHLSLKGSDKNELIDLFQANTTDQNKFYNKDIKRYYLDLVQYLTIDSTHAIYNNVNNDDGEVEDNYDDSEFDIKQKIISYYMNNIKKGHKVDYDEYNRLCGIVYDLAIYYRDSKYHTFILNDDSLDVYFKKAKVQVLIEDYGDEIYILVDEDSVNVKINEIKHLIDKIGIRYTVYIEDNQLDNVLKEYLTYHTLDYGEFVVNSSVIKDIIDICIDGFCMN